MKANRNIFLRFSDFLENIPTKWPEFIVLCLYTTLLGFVAYFHEPWFDEAQSWLIARAASLKEMFFYIPHYEGHPPFWWFILAPFAKAGFPYELTIKTINITLCSIGMGLFLFKAPFKRVIKFLIPFTYFMFYQYGVISRCYCLAIIAFMLVSITYQNRNIKPFAYVGSLMLLCASSAFGIVFSGGLAIVWLLELWPFNLRAIFSKRQFKALALLLVWALFLMFILRPYPDTFATNSTNIENSFFTRFLFLLFVVPLKAFLPLRDFVVLREMPIGIEYLISQILMALPYTFLLVVLFKGFEKFLLFSIPYFLFALFSSLVYFSSWHQGFVSLFIIFVFWQILQEKNHFICSKIFTCFSENIKCILKSSVFVLLFIVLFGSLFYSVNVVKNDIHNYYDYSREMAKFIKEYKLEDKVIFAQWIFFDLSGKLVKNNPTLITYSNILPYFKHNIINNHNFGNDRYPYSIHKIVDNEAYYKKWAQGPKPDIKLGDNFPLNLIWPDITKEEDDFIAIVLKKKDNPPIYMQRKLAKELGLIDKMIEASKHKEAI